MASRCGGSSSVQVLELEVGWECGEARAGVEVARLQEWVAGPSYACRMPASVTYLLCMLCSVKVQVWREAQGQMLAGHASFELKQQGSLASCHSYAADFQRYLATNKPSVTQQGSPCVHSYASFVARYC